MTLATLYLQRIQRETLSLVGVLAQAPEEPFETYWRECGLPAPQVNFVDLDCGDAADWECKRTGLVANYADDWRNQVDHLIVQELPHRTISQLT